jgi:hypothetical protein
MPTRKTDDARPRSAFSDRLRLVLLLDACEAADLTPVPLRRFHALAFLANVLAPVWSVESYDGKVLKRQGGPFYPRLQRELDVLIGLGITSINDVQYIVENDLRCRLDGKLSLNSDRSRALIAAAQSFEAERVMVSFLRRLAFAASRLHKPLEDLVLFDPTWSDQRTGTGDVIDFAEWKWANYTAFAAESFDTLSKISLKTSRSEKLQLYMHLLDRRAHGGS